LNLGRIAKGKEKKDFDEKNGEKKQAVSETYIPAWFLRCPFIIWLKRERGEKKTVSGGGGEGKEVRKNCASLSRPLFEEGEPKGRKRKKRIVKGKKKEGKKNHISDGIWKKCPKERAFCSQLTTQLGEKRILEKTSPIHSFFYLLHHPGEKKRGRGGKGGETQKEKKRDAPFPSLSRM